MCSYANLKQFISNFNKTSRILTGGKFNSSEIAMFDAIKDEPKSVDEVADDLGMSKPAVHSLLSANVRRKNVKVLPDKKEGHYAYILSEGFKYDILDELLEPLTEKEKKQFMEIIDKLNDNMLDIICYAKLNER